jgi:hypothetical protein
MLLNPRLTRCAIDLRNWWAAQAHMCGELKSPKKVLVSVTVEEVSGQPPCPVLNMLDSSFSCDITQLSPIAKPLAGEKLDKRLHRTIKKGMDILLG